jgi:dTDP-L-rhamnose 4-epimerase
VLAIFASRYLNGRPPIIYEDGYQQRDFVHVRDVTRACRLVLEARDAEGQVFNIGSGRKYSIREIAGQMAAVLGTDHIEPIIEGKYRVGDIRHCFADISLAQNVLGYEPRVSLENGLAELAQWLEGQVAIDYVSIANSELAVRGLTI